MSTTVARVPRPYQVEGQNEIRRHFFELDYDNTILSLPPAGGKTFTSVDFARQDFIQLGERCLWVCHTKELVNQAARDFLRSCTDTRVTIWKGEQRDATGQVVVLSNHSYRSFLNHLEENPDLNDFGLMIIDECHHGAGKTYQQLIEGVKHKRRLGLSGTPTRKDNQSFGFTHTAYSRTFRQLSAEGWCARPIYYRFRTGQSHLFAVSRGDYTGASLSSLNNAPRNELIANEFLKNKQYWPGLAFCVNVDHVYEMAKTVRYEAKRLGVECRVALVTGDQSAQAQRDRDRTVSDYLDGKIDLLINCEVFTEGTDFPNVRSVVMARPTASVTKYLQMVLRGGRSFPEHAATGNDPTPGLHPDNVFYILDFVDSAHHYVAASRGWALEHFDEKQVKGELRRTDDLEKKRELVAQDSSAWDLFQKQASEGKEKQWRGLKHEDDSLTKEEWTLCQASSLLVTIDTRGAEEVVDRRILTNEQDFAVLLGTEWISRQIRNRYSTPLQRKQAIQESYRMFGSETFKAADWSNLMQRFISFKIYQGTSRSKEPVWTHITGEDQAPMHEVHEILAEREREMQEADDLVPDVRKLWDEILDTIKRRYPSPVWDSLNQDVKDLRWNNKTLTFTYRKGALVRQAFWLEALAEVVLKHIVDLDDARICMDLPKNTGRPCPTCQKGEVLLRHAARGGKFLSCSNYPKCDWSGSLMRKGEAIAEMRRLLDPVRPPQR